MDLERLVIDLEESFWHGDATFYANTLADDALLVFAGPVGVLSKEQTVESIIGAPRWGEVTLQEVNVRRLAPGVVALVYRAQARRSSGGTAYAALVSSVYVRRRGSWHLALHQQTPWAS